MASGCASEYCSTVSSWDDSWLGCRVTIWFYVRDRVVRDKGDRMYLEHLKIGGSGSKNNRIFYLII